MFKLMSQNKTSPPCCNIYEVCVKPSSGAVPLLIALGTSVRPNASLRRHGEKRLVFEVRYL